MVNDSSADYCLVSRALIEDRLVSVKAKAMYAVLCWCPQGFDCSTKNLSEILGVRREIASRLLTELEDIGYIERMQTSGSDGKNKITEYRIYPRSFI